MNSNQQWPIALESPRIKICGLKREEDGIAALEAGASFLGVILAESPRRIEPSRAKELVSAWQAHNPNARVIGVFVNTPIEEVGAIIEDVGLYAAQLHGRYTVEELAGANFRYIRAFSVRGPQDDPAITEAQELGPVLLDGFTPGMHGGTGKVFDHSLAIPPIRRGPVFIAGGLNPENVIGIMDWLAAENAVPYALDVSSGLEQGVGVKSRPKIVAFMEAVYRGMSSKPEIKLP